VSLAQTRAVSYAALGSCKTSPVSGSIFSTPLNSNRDLADDAQDQLAVRRDPRMVRTDVAEPRGVVTRRRREGEVDVVDRDGALRAVEIAQTNPADDVRRDVDAALLAKTFFVDCPRSTRPPPAMQPLKG
jgi:hypothetical protein